jgi:hypothetical protein
MYISAKMIPIETIPGMKGGSKRETLRIKCKYDIFDTL